MLDGILVLRVSNFSFFLFLRKILEVLFQVFVRLNLGFETTDHPFSQLLLLVNKVSGLRIFFHKLQILLVVLGKFVIFMRLVRSVRWGFCDVNLLDNNTVIIWYLLNSLVYSHIWAWATDILNVLRRRYRSPGLIDNAVVDVIWVSLDSGLVVVIYSRSIIKSYTLCEVAPIRIRGRKVSYNRQILVRSEMDHLCIYLRIYNYLLITVYFVF